jgi:hypothetical protein
MGRVAWTRPRSAASRSAPSRRRAVNAAGRRGRRAACACGAERRRRTLRPGGRRKRGVRSACRWAKCRLIRAAALPPMSPAGRARTTFAVSRRKAAARSAGRRWQCPLQAISFSFADPMWVGELLLGVRLMMFGQLASVLLLFATICMDVLALLLRIVAEGAVAAGAWKVTQPEPGSVSRSAIRPIARVCMLAGPIAAVLEINAIFSAAPTSAGALWLGARWIYLARIAGIFFTCTRSRTAFRHVSLGRTREWSGGAFARAWRPSSRRSAWACFLISLARGRRTT